jgi:hypothetical protein
MGEGDILGENKDQHGGGLTSLVHYFHSLLKPYEGDKTRKEYRRKKDSESGKQMCKSNKHI